MFRLVLVVVVVVDDEEGVRVWSVEMSTGLFCGRPRISGDDDDEDGDVKADPTAASDAIKTTRQSMEILIALY